LRLDQKHFKNNPHASYLEFDRWLSSRISSFTDILDNILSFLTKIQICTRQQTIPIYLIGRMIFTGFFGQEVVNTKITKIYSIRQVKQRDVLVYRRACKRQSWKTNFHKNVRCAARI